MAKKHNKAPDVSFISNPNVSHEESDVRIKPIVWFGIWLMVSTVLIYLIIWGLFNYFERRAEKSETPPPPLAEERQPLPPEPRLQLAPSRVGQKQPDLNEHPLAELKKMKEEEEKQLTNYSVDPATGAIRIPIKVAKRLVLERNLLQSAPATAQQASAPQADLKRPANSNSSTATERRQQ
jgi:cytoskeletal protein RodZ